MSERTSERPSTPICILGYSGPQCHGRRKKEAATEKMTTKEKKRRKRKSFRGNDKKEGKKKVYDEKERRKQGIMSPSHGSPSVSDHKAAIWPTMILSYLYIAKS